jgi:hypothetical protein
MMACSRRLARSLTLQVSVSESHDWVGTGKSDTAAFFRSNADNRASSAVNEPVMA